MIRVPEKINNSEIQTDLYFAVSKQEISLVNAKTGLEYPVVKQQAQTENDGLFQPWLTYSMRQASNGSRILANIKLHYFESNFNYQGVLLRSTYNCFEMREDFIYMLQNCQEILPIAKHELVERVKHLLQN